MYITLDATTKRVRLTWHLELYFDSLDTRNTKDTNKNSNTLFHSMYVNNLDAAARRVRFTWHLELSLDARNTI